MILSRFGTQARRPEFVNVSKVRFVWGVVSRRGADVGREQRVVRC